MQDSCKEIVLSELSNWKADLKNDFEDSENAKQNDLDRTSRDYRLKPRGKRSEYLESLWDSLAAMFG